MQGARRTQGRLRDQSKPMTRAADHPYISVTTLLRPIAILSQKENPMDWCDIPYLLKRSRSHRSLAAAATCVEARSIHRVFVKKYQMLLAEIRRNQLRERRARPCLPFRNGACDCRQQEPIALAAPITSPLNQSIGQKGAQQRPSPFPAIQDRGSLVLV